MKSKQSIPVLTTGLILLTLLATASAQPAPNVPNPAPAVHPMAGSFGGGSGGQAADPATGLPLVTAPAEPQWIDPNWGDPDLVLANVKYDNLPLSEVTRDLRDRFKGLFNILPMPNTYGTSWGDTPIQLELKNVRASDVFNAMNLVFENDHTPLRWELKANGHPLAQLRVLSAAAPIPGTALPPPPPVETQRLVIFVGNLLGDEKAGGMSMEQIVKTISEIWPDDFGDLNKVITFHKDAQMLVVNGTHPQLDFVQQVLLALGRKAELARPRENDLKDLEELGKVLQKEPYSNILRSIFKSEQK